ncbi:transposase DDE domain protein [archaeon BMS3Bbin15]|nr:transposase DDE domain protein [archaeon BMS3Bbin15]
MTPYRDRYFRTLKTLDTFVDRALGLTYKGKHLSGFHYTCDLLRAASANTYLETVGKRADSIQMAIKQVPTADVYWEYRKTVEILGGRFTLNEQDVILAFDYTDEDFYGDVQGFWIHGWTGKHAVTGKFKFLICAIVSADIPQRISLISVPVRIGHNMAKEICWCLAMVRPLVRSIKLVLFDRGFYSKDVMLTLANAEYPYLIFVPKNKQVQKELAQMAESQKKTLLYQFKLNKDKTILRGETTLAFLKGIFDKRRNRTFDWCFATSESSINLDYIIPTYKGRWRIETGFRVQDEARIKSKSKDPRIRFFFFAYEQILQILWIVLYKEEVSFKEFLLGMYDLCTERNRKVKG